MRNNIYKNFFAFITLGLTYINTYFFYVKNYKKVQ